MAVPGTITTGANPDRAQATLLCKSCK